MLDSNGSSFLANPLRFILDMSWLERFTDTVCAFVAVYCKLLFTLNILCPVQRYLVILLTVGLHELLLRPRIQIALQLSVWREIVKWLLFLGRRSSWNIFVLSSVLLPILIHFDINDLEVHNYCQNWAHRKLHPDHFTSIQLTLSLSSWLLALSTIGYLYSLEFQIFHNGVDLGLHDYTSHHRT